MNAILKIVHGPTVQQMVLDSTRELGNISRRLEALMFSIYLMAVLSMQDEECKKTMGESRTVLIERYSHATQQALIDAEYLRNPDVILLQAFTLYLVCSISGRSFPLDIPIWLKGLLYP